MHAEPVLCDDGAPFDPLRHAQRALTGVRLVHWEETIAKVLSKKGYATGLFEKWHLGNMQGRFPTDQGFDEWYGIPDATDETLWPTQPGFDPSVVHVLHIY